jgi:protein involved in polysaccharide export with SLBB domain
MKLPKSFQFSIVLFSILLCRIVAAAQAPPAQENVQREEDLIHFGDLIDVDVLGSVEFDWRGRLTPEGFLDGIEFVEEPVFGLCRSVDTVSLDIAKGYEKLLRDPKVVVRIIDRSNRAVSLLEGAVKKPQRFQIKRVVRLNELLIVSGGLTEQASGEIHIFRPQNLSCAAKKSETENAAKTNAPEGSQFVKASRIEGSQTFSVAVAELLSGKADANPQILSGDIVTVLEAAPIYIIGGVRSPKQISSRTQTTLSRAVDSAGGLTKEATENSVLVFRRTGGETKIIEADLTKIKAKQAEDIQLQGYDVVDVGQKGSPKKIYPPVIQTSESNVNKSAVLPLRVID